MKRTLELCANTLIPSILPFLAVNSIFSGAGGIDLAARILGRPFSKLFGVSGNLCAPFLVGLISGFPSGATAVAEVYTRGGCTRTEAERALAFCSNTGPAFAVAGIGGMLGGVKMGAAVYCIQIFCAWLSSLILPGRGASELALLSPNRKEQKDVFINAVTGTVKPMLNICAFVLIFSPVAALVQSFLMRSGAGDTVCALSLSFIEITNACAFITSTFPSRLALPFCSLAVCWSGLCVMAQTKAEVADFGLSMKYCIAGKLFMAVSAFVISCFIGVCFNGVDFFLMV